MPMEGLSIRFIREKMIRLIIPRFSGDENMEIILGKLKTLIRFIKRTSIINPRISIVSLLV